jgi:nitroreductase
MAEEDREPTHHGVDDTPGCLYPNETIRLLLERSSCRSFEDREIPREVLDLVFEAGTRAPTGGNLQPFSIIKITDSQTKVRLAELVGGQRFVATAPVDLLFCLDYHRLERWARLEKAPFAAASSFRHFWIGFQDTIIAAQNICTAADALGLGSVYVGTVLECLRELRGLFKLPNGVFPIVLLSLGYPKVRPAPKKKLAVPVIVHDGAYRELPDSELLAAFESKYPGWKKEVTDERLERIERLCRTLHGDDYARESVNQIRHRGYINAVQNYFGLHYAVDEMTERNELFIALMKEAGFDCFGKFVPQGNDEQKL